MRWLFFIFFYILVDIYAFQAVKTISKSKTIYIIYWVISALVLGNLIYQIYINMSRSGGLTPYTNQAIGYFLVSFVPKIAILFFIFGEDIIRTPQAIFSFFTEGKSVEGNHFPSRRKFVSQLAMVVAALPFSSLLYGMYKGKYNYKVLKYALEFDDLPDAFDGYQITQISDIHSGSFDNAENVLFQYSAGERKALIPIKKFITL